MVVARNTSNLTRVALEQGLAAHAAAPRAKKGKPAERKVFLQERVASLLLATQPQWRSRAHDPFGMGWSMSRFRQHPTEAFISDALKLAWREQAYPEYLQAFATLRDRFSKGLLPVAGA